MFWDKKLSFEEVILFLETNSEKIDNELAERIMKIIAKSKANDIFGYRVAEWLPMMLTLGMGQDGLR